MKAARLEGATELDLSDIGLSELPESIGSLSQLRSHRSEREVLWERGASAIKDYLHNSDGG